MELPLGCTWETRGCHQLIRVSTPQGQGLISLSGAQLLSWTPAGGEPLVWLSPGADFDNGKPLRGGIPLCWPWFGPSVVPGLPQHGLARQLPWTLTASTALEQATKFTFELRDSDASRAIWPHAFILQLTLQLGQSIELAFRMRHAAATPQTLGFCLHSYFAVPDALAATVSGVAGAMCHDKIVHISQPQTGTLQPGANYDAVFTGASGQYTLHRAPWPDIHIQTSNAPSVIVWNPGDEKSPTDMPDRCWTGMLCVEPGAAMEDRFILAPDTDYLTTMRISTGAA
ncbi:D-hexose-6-phosphate mutarotase [Burkholderiaceae bacterium DAT-1]|nr:D-hexose-6-phosphate mutarotase [Burkholderiaceae bacterium DAT-1]